jgi:energy-coupling factor transport system ATP-binding protein
VAFGLGAKRGLFRRASDDARARERAHAALAAVGLEAHAGTHPLELPASSRRLLALAAVIARQPAVLALDEPTVGLDRHGLAILDTAMADAAARGAAVVMVTHDLRYARARAHRILSLEGGVLSEAH